MAKPLVQGPAAFYGPRVVFSRFFLPYTRGDGRDSAFLRFAQQYPVFERFIVGIQTDVDFYGVHSG